MGPGVPMNSIDGMTNHNSLFVRSFQMLLSLFLIIVTLLVPCARFLHGILSNVRKKNVIIMGIARAPSRIKKITFNDSPLRVASPVKKLPPIDPVQAILQKSPT